MPVIPDLRRFLNVDASEVKFKNVSIPQSWKMPENIRVVVQRVDHIHDSVISLYEHALSLLKSASDFVKLVNRRDDFLFRLDEDTETSSPYLKQIASLDDVLRLAVRTGAITSWNAECFAARQELDKATSAFASLATEAEFLRLVYPWCPLDSLNRIDLENW